MTARIALFTGSFLLPLPLPLPLKTSSDSHQRCLAARLMAAWLLSCLAAQLLNSLGIVAVEVALLDLGDVWRGTVKPHPFLLLCAV